MNKPSFTTDYQSSFFHKFPSQRYVDSGRLGIAADNAIHYDAIPGRMVYHVFQCQPESLQICIKQKSSGAIKMVSALVCPGDQITLPNKCSYSVINHSLTKPALLCYTFVGHGPAEDSASAEGAVELGGDI